MKRTLIFHPLLFAIYPIVFLFSHNLERMSIDISEIFLPIIVTTISTLIVWFILILIIKDGRKSGILASIFLLIVFSYWHLITIVYLLLLMFITWALILSIVLVLYYILYYIVKDTTKAKTLSLIILCLVLVYGQVFSFGIFSDFLISAYTTLDSIENWIISSFINLVYIFLAAIIIRSVLKASEGSIINLTICLNIVAIILIVLSTSTIVYKLLAWQIPVGRMQIQSTNILLPEHRPDIYYIILDGYGRQDILQEYYGYDNSNFIKELESRGFYIANESRSNYAYTVHSIASSLNFDYLVEGYVPMLSRLIRYNNVSAFLRQQGYKFVSFSTGYSPTEVKNADIVMSPRLELSEFHNMLIFITPLPIVLEYLKNNPQYSLHRGRILYTFDNLPNASENGSPIFVYAHIMVPHPPFVFDEMGNPITPKRYFTISDGPTWINSESDKERYISGYIKQLIFTNAKVLETVDDILSNSQEPPIIILQADHGPRSTFDSEGESWSVDEMTSIFNAYYLPQGGDKHLYNSITPVNTFRIVLNHYFNTEFELLNDDVFYANFFHRFNRTNVTKNSE